MFKTFYQSLAAAVLFLLAGHAAAAADVDTILKKADAFRLPSASAQLEAVVTTFRNGQQDKEKRYQILVRPGGKSLVLSRSPGESGQKVLMSGDDFWLLVPGSARPLRITPMQKLLGEASTGDIANMTWAGDYSGTVLRELDVDGVPCLELDLRALRKSLSYQRVLLQVARSDFRPVHADLFAASERRIKQARFSVETRDGRASVTRMTLIDEIQTSRETQVHLLSNQPRQFGDELFNPMYLSRSDAP